MKINTLEEYEAALSALEKWIDADAPEGSEAARTLATLADDLEAFEKIHFKFQNPHWEVDGIAMPDHALIEIARDYGFAGEDAQKAARHLRRWRYSVRKLL